MAKNQQRINVDDEEYDRLRKSVAKHIRREISDMADSIAYIYFDGQTDGDSLESIKNRVYNKVENPASYALTLALKEVYPVESAAREAEEQSYTHEGRIAVASRLLAIPEEILRQAEWWERMPYTLVGNARVYEETYWEMKLNSHGYSVHGKITHDSQFIPIEDEQPQEE